MRGQLIKRGKDTWLLRVYLGEVNGKRRYQARTVHGMGKKEAEAELRRWVQQIETGNYVAPAKITVAELLDRYMAWAKENLAPTSVDRYSDIVEIHLKPGLGHVPLARLNTLVINDFYATLRKDAKGKKKELAPATLRLTHTVLHRALDAAVRWKLIPSNPAKGADLPRRQRNQVQALTPEQARELLRAATGTPLYIPVLLGLTTGMRLGEICALRWEDVDLEAGTISVRHTLARRKEDKKLFLKPPKTRSSLRQIELDPEVTKALRAHKRQQAEERLRRGDAWEDWGLVFCGKDGRPREPQSLNARLKLLMKRAGLPVLSSHKAWRHTAATLMLAQGVHPKVVQERLGHSSISMTLDLYSHLVPGMQRAAAEKVTAFLLGDEGQRGRKA